LLRLFEAWVGGVGLASEIAMTPVPAGAATLGERRIRALVPPAKSVFRYAYA
jgi:hypothetical protein